MYNRRMNEYRKNGMYKYKTQFQQKMCVLYASILYLLTDASRRPRH